MTTNLYNEAIAEAKKLKEMAEQNAKNKIIEAVTPRIRRLIEQEISDDLEDLDLDIESSGFEPEEEVPDGLLDLGSSPSIEQPLSPPMEIEEEIEDDNKNVNINITVEGSKNRTMELDLNSLHMLRNVLNVKSRITLKEGISKVNVIRNKAIMLKKVLESTDPTLSLNMKLNTIYNKLISEADSLGGYQLQDTRESRKFNKLVLETKKEMKLMPRKYRRRGWLFEQEEDLGLDAELGGGEGEVEEVPEETAAADASEVEMELQGLIDAIAPESGLEVSVAGEEGGEDEGELDLEDEEAGG